MVQKVKNRDPDEAWHSAMRVVQDPEAADQELPGDFLLDHLKQVLAAGTVDEVWQLHLAKMAAYGFDRLLYGASRFMWNPDRIELDDLLLISNHSQEFLDGYFGRGYHHHDPICRWARRNSGVCGWGATGSINPATLSEDERRVLAYNRAMGLVAGYTVSFPESSARSIGVIGLCAAPGLTQQDADAIWASSGDEIVAINQITHLKICSLPTEDPKRSLTARQREALEWVYEGRTIQDIATVMGVSPATVEKHLRLAREVLGVDTTAQAVLKASLHHQIFCSSR